MTDLDTRRPEFTTALRGYDRLQVDEYIDRLQQLVRHAEERVRDAELGGDYAPQTDVGPRISQMLDLASVEAREVRVQAHQEANETISNAQDQARAMLDEAEETALANSEDAAARHAAQLQDYAGERSRLERELADLEAHKHAVVEEIIRLRDALGAAPGLSVAATPAIDAPSAISADPAVGGDPAAGGDPAVGGEAAVAPAPGAAPLLEAPVKDDPDLEFEFDEVETRKLPRRTRSQAA